MCLVEVSFLCRNLGFGKLHIVGVAILGRLEFVCTKNFHNLNYPAVFYKELQNEQGNEDFGYYKT